jgi:serine/threonine-protein kinase RsbW
VTAPRPPRWEMSAIIPASLGAIEGLFAAFRHWQRGLAGGADAFGAELLLREVLTNAVVHGCGKDPSKQVRCSWRLRNGSVLIAVADDGPGFDWRAAAGRQPDDENTSGRGMEILRAYSTRVRFNARGNSVVILKRF